MLLACRLAGLSALQTYYAGVRARAQCGLRRATVGWPGSGLFWTTTYPPVPAPRGGHRLAFALVVAAVVAVLVWALAAGSAWAPAIKHVLDFRENVVSKDGAMKNDALHHITVATPYPPTGMRAKKADAANPGKSSREVAAAATVSHVTVQRLRRAGGTDVPPEKIVGRDGKPYPAQHAPSRALSLRLRVAIDVAAVLVAALIAVALVGRP